MSTTPTNAPSTGSTTTTQRPPVADGQAGCDLITACLDLTLGRYTFQGLNQLGPLGSAIFDARRRLTEGESINTTEAATYALLGPYLQSNPTWDLLEDITDASKLSIAARLGDRAVVVNDLEKLKGQIPRTIERSELLTGMVNGADTFKTWTENFEGTRLGDNVANGTCSAIKTKLEEMKTEWTSRAEDLASRDR